MAGQFTDVPTFFGVEFKAVLVLVPKSVRFTGKLLKRPFSAYRARLEQGFAAAGVEDEVSLTTSAPLHVLSEGTAPIAALIPAYGARTSFSYEAATLHLRTAFSPERDPPSQYSDEDNAPAIDVLGRTKILWADVSRVRRPLTYAAFKLPVIFASSQAEAERIAASRSTAGIEVNSGSPLPDLKPPPKGYRRIAVLGFPGAFAIRIIVGAPTPGWFSQLKPGAESGAVVVSDPLAAAARRRLRREFAAADRKPIVRLRGLWQMIYNAPHRSPTTPIKDAYKRATFSFEYPPNPPYDGINVFGAVSELKLAEAQGDLTLGTHPETINAPTPLELRDIVGTGVVGKRFFVPIRLAASGAHIQVQGSADTRINGIPVTKRASIATRAFGTDRVMLFAAVGALLSGLLGLVQLRRTEPQSSSVRWPKARS